MFIFQQQERKFQSSQIRTFCCQNNTATQFYGTLSEDKHRAVFSSSSLPGYSIPSSHSFWPPFPAYIVSSFPYTIPISSTFTLIPKWLPTQAQHSLLGYCSISPLLSTTSYLLQSLLPSVHAHSPVSVFSWLLGFDPCHLHHTISFQLSFDLIIPFSPANWFSVLLAHISHLLLQGINASQKDYCQSTFTIQKYINDTQLH